MGSGNWEEVNGRILCVIFSQKAPVCVLGTVLIALYGCLQLSWQLNGDYDRHLPNGDNIGKIKTGQILLCCSTLL